MFSGTKEEMHQLQSVAGDKEENSWRREIKKWNGECSQVLIMVVLIDTCLHTTYVIITLYFAPRGKYTDILAPPSEWNMLKQMDANRSFGL